MANNPTYKGARWYKCDLHLHTPASACFEDKTVTAQQWVSKALEQGLNCVAVTDHNTGVSIDEIKAAAMGTGLVVFPGVEITCDSSKIHLIVLFGTDRSTEDIRDFLVKAGIETKDFGTQDAFTSESVFEITKLAISRGGIVIPAHIDEYNGLESVSVANLNKFYAESEIVAVQVVHKNFLDSKLVLTGNEELKKKLNEYYNGPKIPIDDATVTEWAKTVKYALKNELAIVTFSDNPQKPKDPKHGLAGIGSRFTWIKMNETPSLEGLRQAFLMPASRVINDFDAQGRPYTPPFLWIKSISVANSTIAGDPTPLKIEFNPQLNTIIGGRGSGKSSILRFIRGVFNRTADLEDLKDILEDHHEFYKRVGGRPTKGVLTAATVVEIEFVRDGIIYRIAASNIEDSAKQEVKIERLNVDGIWELVTDEGYIDFFMFDHYSQKQIYEIAQEPNALRERIDRAIPEIEAIKVDRERVKNEFMEISASIRSKNLSIAGKGKMETLIRDLDASIGKLQNSGIAQVISKKEHYDTQNTELERFVTGIERQKAALSEVIATIGVAPIDESLFAEEYLKEIRVMVQAVADRFAEKRQELAAIVQSLNMTKVAFVEGVNQSLWKAAYNSNLLEFNQKKEELKKEGIDAITSFEKLSSERTGLQLKLDQINMQVRERDLEVIRREDLQREYLLLCKAITEKRTGFLASMKLGDKVKVEVRAFRNKTDFEAKLRRILQRGDGFQSDIESLAGLCFQGGVEQKIVEVRDVFSKIRKGELLALQVTGYFLNLVKGISEAQMDELALLLPEDEIVVKYRSYTGGQFKPLSTASAGQKTTAILTFILSHGQNPLILDQPEDDLDNRLVYELIVDRLSEVKTFRQLIVVTHNANVPVNGDAEYIVSMDTNSKSLEVLHAGTVDQVAIKKEICDVMEGGQEAFKMRSKRYRYLDKQLY